MSSKPTAEGMTTQAFAAYLGKSVQWARKLKRENAQEWVDFCARQQQRAVAPVASRPAVREVEVFRAPRADGPADDLQRALDAKELLYGIFLKAAEAAANGSGSTVEQAALNRAAKEARDSYEKAGKHASALLKENELWVSIERVAAIRDALRQLSDVVQNFETTLAGRMPDEMRPALYEAYKLSRPAWNSAIRSLDAYINTLLPVPC